MVGELLSPGGPAFDYLPFFYSRVFSLSWQASQQRCHVPVYFVALLQAGRGKPWMQSCCACWCAEGWERLRRPQSNRGVRSFGC